MPEVINHKKSHSQKNFDFKSHPLIPPLMSPPNTFIINNTRKNELTRDDFMEFFRDDEKLNLLSVDDRVEVFSTILLGSSDFKKRLFDEIFSDYCVSHLEVIEIENG